ncbi:anti-sigma factor [Methylobacterium sp. BTF04]|nr:anti-sigma factor [Methylobacterium sp. BTF04]
MDDAGQGKSPSKRLGAAQAGQDGNAHHDHGAQAQGLSDHTQKRIGLHLRAMYDTIVQQPVPDRFRDLIAQLDSSSDPV